MSSPQFGAVDADVEPFAVVAIASSAGGIVALGKVLGGLPLNLTVPVLVVQHLDPRRRTVIAEVLGRRSQLKVKLAENDEQVEPGTIYVAPPNHHLLVGEGGVVSLTSTELVHFLRPSADLFFESIAGSYGPRAIACVLTGTGSDGAMGVRAVKSRGGTVIVEDPETAEFNGMPKSAVETGAADFVLPLDEINAVITGLVEARSTRP